MGYYTLNSWGRAPAFIGVNMDHPMQVSWEKYQETFFFVNGYLISDIKAAYEKGYQDAVKEVTKRFESVIKGDENAA